uniref:Rps4 n=1 Tax=Oxytricha trifallax TaxID=1172189 RepID=G9HRF6_9SPIT|nr:rps4 [Oxytricha trifallax]
MFRKYRGRRNKFFLTKFFFFYNSKISKNLKFKKTKTNFTNFNFFRPSFSYFNYFSFFNFAKKLKLKKTQRPHNLLKSKVWFPFVHFSIGFLYLDALNSLSLYKKNNSWFLKKLLYSFASKNDLQNFILKKYLKNNYRAVNKKFRNYSFIPDCEPYIFFSSYRDNEKNTNSFWIENSDRLTKFPSNYFNQNNNSSLSFFKSNSLFTAKLSSIDWESILGEPSHLKSLNSIEYGFSIKKTKFKPGYSSMWRNYRNTLKISLNLKFKYQHQLTKYLLKFNKIIRNKLYLLFEMQLDNVLTLSKFFPDRNWSIFFIREGLVFINGFKVRNIFEQLFKNDFIQLVVSLKYYVVYRWLLNWQVIKKNRFKNKVHKKLNFKNLSEDKQKSKNLPLWILKHKNIREDVTKYLEIDYFSLSFFILYEPLYLTDINPLSFLNVRFNVINLFNWKYIN